MNDLKKNSLIWGVGFVILILFFNFFQNTVDSGQKKLNFSQFLSKIESKEIISIKFEGKDIEGVMKDGSLFTTYGGFDHTNVLDIAYKNGVQIDINPPDTKSSILLKVFISWFPMILFLLVWLFFIRQVNGGSKGAFGFGKSKAKMMTDKSEKVTFKDVGGIEEAKEDMFELVEFLKEPIKFQKLGGRIPKGCLLIGPPGTGKTLLARAIAGEANVPFFSISGSDFVEMFVGVGASRVRDMFEQAKKNSPCIIFIDEIDAIGKSRGSANFGGGNDEREQTLNQMLVEMDGFDKNHGIIIIAATNRPDVLDSALLRPGRFDRQIVLSNPDIKGREEIIRLYLSKIKANENIDINLIARATPGFSGADLANLINESALKAARHNKTKIEQEDIQVAKDKIMMGTQKKTRSMNENERKLTAYHEGGHALIALMSIHSDPIYKVTIIPTNMALGMVVRLPESDKFFMSRAKLIDDIAVAMGGRAAEEIIFGKDMITTGASSDIKAATSLAKAMVERWGMSSVVGTIDYGKSGDVYNQNYYSDTMRQKIDDEIAKIVKEGYENAKKILNENIKSLHKIAEVLLEKETLTGEQVKELIGIKTKQIDNDISKNIKETVISAEAQKKDNIDNIKNNENDDVQNDLKNDGKSTKTRKIKSDDKNNNK